MGNGTPQFDGQGVLAVAPARKQGEKRKHRFSRRKGRPANMSELDISTAKRDERTCSNSATALLHNRYESGVAAPLSRHAIEGTQFNFSTDMPFFLDPELHRCWQVVLCVGG
jgi:hypothetical protein